MFSLNTRNHENRSLTEITEHTEEFNRLLLFTVSTRNHENMVLAESAEFAEINLKADPTLRELSGLCVKPF